MPTHDTRLVANPSGLCLCGCGLPTPIATQTNRSTGLLLGFPTRYIRGHQRRFRLEGRYEIDPDSGCHIWIGRVNTSGYAQIQINERSVLVHRAVWERAHGPIPGGFDLHHRCEVKRCINVMHIELLTRADHAHRHSRLSWDDIAVIRALRGKATQADLAARFGIAESTVGAIQLGKIWKGRAA